VKGARTSVRLRAVRRLKPGRYTLVLTVGDQRIRTSLRLR
jgi:hypothetical protein